LGDHRDPYEKLYDGIDHLIDAIIENTKLSYEDPVLQALRNFRDDIPDYPALKEKQ
jgi:hypothetical protein